MHDLNSYIDTAQKFAAPASMDTIPGCDRSQQVSYGVELAQRAAQQQKQEIPPPKAMPPIVPVAN